MGVVVSSMCLMMNMSRQGKEWVLLLVVNISDDEFLLKSRAKNIPGLTFPSYNNIIMKYIMVFFHI